MNPLQDAPSPTFYAGNLLAFAFSAVGLLVAVYWIYVGWRALMALEKIARQHDDLSNSLRAIAQDEEG